MCVLHSDRGLINEYRIRIVLYRIVSTYMPLFGVLSSVRQVARTSSYTESTSEGCS